MIRDALVAAGYVAGWRGVRMLPEETAHRLFRTVADRVYARDGQGVRQLRGNLAVAAPDAALEPLTRAAVRSYLRYWCEVFRLPSWPTDDLVRRTRCVGEQHLRDAFAATGAIVALPHTANWDWAGAWACATGMPVTTVAERLRPARVYDEFVAARRALGFEVLALDGADTMRDLSEALDRGRLVCLLSDRDLTGSGVGVRFLGSRARLPAGPALLARRTGAALVPASFAYAGRDLELTFHAPVTPGRPSVMMQAVADAFSDGIRSHPQDWHMMQPVFEDRLQEARR